MSICHESQEVICARAREAEGALAAALATLRELRVRLHAAGRRPEECYEMSIIDEALTHSRDRIFSRCSMPGNTT